MSCPSEWFRRVDPLVERIEVLSRLSPCLASDEELAFTQALLLSMIGDYTQQLRHVLTDLAREHPEEETPHA